MNDQPVTNNAPSGDSNKTLTHVIYGSYVAGFLIPFAPIIGLVMAYIKRDEVGGTIYASHFTWLIRTFWAGLVGALIMIVLTITVILAPVAWLLGILIFIWWIFRIVKGWMKLFDNQAVPNPEKWF